MKYFTPETSKKLEEMGLKPSQTHMRPYQAARENPPSEYCTLDICEIENAKKLFGEVGIYSKMAHYPDSVYETNPIPKMYEVGLEDYITLTDEERVKYVEDYLHMI